MRVLETSTGRDLGERIDSRAFWPWGLEVSTQRTSRRYLRFSVLATWNEMKVV